MAEKEAGQGHSAGTRRFVNVWGRRLNRVISGIYTLVIASLQATIWYFYVVLIRRIVWVSFSLPFAIVHTCMSFYFLINVGINYILCLTVPPSTSPPRHDIENGPAALTNGFDEEHLTKSQMQRICEPCGAPKPPRTHHCSLCGRCYVRLCHHCPALGRCVARDNYAYFFRFIAHAFTGCLFAAATCKWLLDHWRVWRGVLGTKETKSALNVMIIIMFAAIGAACATGLLFFWNVFLACSGQTTIEWFDNRRVRRSGMAPAKWGRFGGPFSRDLRSNLQDAFGVPIASFLPWWSVVFLPLEKFPRE